MPLSDFKHRPWILRKLEDYLPGVRSVVDVGAGLGGYREFFMPFTPDARWTAIEIWEPYVDRFLLRYRYHEVFVGDVREVTLPEADLYFVGDVLEHMPRADALKTWDRIMKVCEYAVLSLPIRHYPQGECEGNPYEAHVDHWDENQVLAQLRGTDRRRYTANGDTGAFIARGDRL